MNQKQFTIYDLHLLLLHLIEVHHFIILILRFPNKFLGKGTNGQITIVNSTLLLEVYKVLGASVWTIGLQDLRRSGPLSIGATSYSIRSDRSTGVHNVVLSPLWPLDSEFLKRITCTREYCKAFWTPSMASKVIQHLLLCCQLLGTLYPAGCAELQGDTDDEYCPVWFCLDPFFFFLDFDTVCSTFGFI